MMIMKGINFSERFQRVRKYFRRTSKEEVILLINQAIHELSEIERRTDEIWNHINSLNVKGKKKIYIELAGEELDKISESVERIKELLNKAKGNVKLSHKKEYEIELWI
jgi:Cu/Ag efflux pump CusA